MGTRVYYSTDAGAPVLSGSAGALVAVLDACLVTGYGSQAGAGWSKPFAATGRGVYQAPAGNRFALDVDDTGTTTARIRGFETASGVGAGSGPFPTDTQLSGGLYVAKSTVADGSARKWIVQADEQTVIVHVACYAPLPDAFSNWGFGDLVGASAADAFATFIHGATSSSNALNVAPGAATGRGNLAFASGTAGTYMPRVLAGTGTSYNALLQMVSTATTGSGSTTFPAPDLFGNVFADPIQCVEGTAALGIPRGYVPGILYLRNYLDASTHPHLTAFGDKITVRYGATHSLAYLIDAANWR